MSRPQVVVAGSGKMARDVGAYFLSRGHPVAWVSRAADRLEGLERWVRRRLRRLERAARDGGPRPGTPTFHVLGDAGLPRADLFVECINEDEDEKRALLEALDAVVPDQALWVSNTSSIAPDALHADCAGLHFFYPVELTGFVEAVFPRGFSSERRRRLRELLDDLRLECIEEEPEAAFAVNRLLMPLQAEAMRLVLAGHDPAAVDEATASTVLPVGQLSLMDTIGLDVVEPAVRNYVSRLSLDVAAHYAPLTDGLGTMLDVGKRGRKNKDGFLVGAPLPWPRQGDAVIPAHWPARMRCLFANLCAHAVERRWLSEDQLSLALAALFDWTGSLEAMLSPMSVGEARETLDRAWRETGRPYFIPAAKLRGPDAGDWPAQGALV